MTTDLTLAVDNDAPILRRPVDLARDLARMCTLAALIDVANSHDGAYFVTWVDPTRAFEVWGRTWNVVYAKRHPSGWHVTGDHVEVPK